MEKEIPGGAIESMACSRTEGEMEYRCIRLEDARELAVRFGVSGREISIASLERGVVPLRYLKNVGSIGLQGQARLLRSYALVLGAGGLGGLAAELLARYGVGHITVVDPDAFEETNLNRQLLSSEPALGTPKAETAVARISTVNSDVEVTALRTRAGESNLDRLLEGVDVAVDALDNFSDRLALQQACRRLEVVMVHAAIAGFSFQVTTVFPGEEGVEPLFAEREEGSGAEVDAGVLAGSAAAAASVQAQEAVRVLLELQAALRGRLLFVDMEDWDVQYIDLRGE